MVFLCQIAVLLQYLSKKQVFIHSLKSGDGQKSLFGADHSLLPSLLPECASHVGFLLLYDHQHGDGAGPIQPEGSALLFRFGGGPRACRSGADADRGETAADPRRGTGGQRSFAGNPRLAGQSEPPALCRLPQPSAGRAAAPPPRRGHVACRHMPVFPCPSTPWRLGCATVADGQPGWLALRRVHL